MTAGRRVRRRPTDLIWLAAEAVALVLCALPVHTDRVGALVRLLLGVPAGPPEPADAAAAPDARKVA